jgi:superfamily II DNA/RNA helicase
MRQGGVSVLVCSDAFARGMDFADVQVPKRVPPPQKTGSHCNAFA